jgi:flagellin-like protein
MRLRRKAFGRKAVSPLLATIILIAITVAAGLVIYNVFFSTAGTISSQLNIQIVSIDLVRTSSTKLFSITIKNSGNKPISSINVTAYLEPSFGTNPVAWTFSGSSLNLQPGQVWSSSGTSLPTGAKDLVVGQSYPVTISVTASDGSKLDKNPHSHNGRRRPSHIQPVLQHSRNHKLYLAS